MQRLNLPECQLQLRRKDDAVQVFDRLRQRYVALTPEEWVRQHFVEFLVNQCSYPAPRMANEVRLTLNGMSRRCDSVVYDREMRPRIIIEYKRPDVALSQRVFDQICRYNIVMQVDYLIVSNGLQHFCCRMNYDTQTYSFIEQIPSYDSL